MGMVLQSLAESREQRAESREQRAESREQRAENRFFSCDAIKDISYKFTMKMRM